MVYMRLVRVVALQTTIVVRRSCVNDCVTGAARSTWLSRGGISRRSVFQVIQIDPLPFLERPPFSSSHASGLQIPNGHRSPLVKVPPYFGWNGLRSLIVKVSSLRHC